MAESNRICSVDGCGKTARSRGMCSGHHHKLKRHGDPLVCIRTPRGLSQEFIETIAIPYQGKECLEWPYDRSTGGYGRVTVGGKRVQTHRYVCLRINGLPPTRKHQAAHECGNRICVNPNHLSWKTRLENKADELVHGTRNRGGRNGRSKLTENEVREIIALDGFATKTAIAERYGISRGHVSEIHSGKTWAWLQE